MIYKEQIEKVIKEIVEYAVAPCIKCNNDIYAGDGIESVKDEDGKRIDIELFNHAHFGSDGSYLNSGGRCHKCGNIYSERYGKWKSEAANIWNKSNDINTLITFEQIKIIAANEEIKRLSDLDKERKTLSK